MLARDNVVRLVLAEGELLGKQTILTAKPSPSGNHSAQSDWDVSRHAVPGEGPVQPALSA